MARKGTSTLATVAASQAQLVQGQSPRPHEADVERVEPPGRSWLWQWFHHRPDREKTFFCNTCCSGKEGTVDIKAWSIRSLTTMTR